MSALAAAATSLTARSNAIAFALDGLWNPLSFLTNWSEAERTSSSVAGGSKLNSVLILRHIDVPLVDPFELDRNITDPSPIEFNHAT
jgi:hypothetical protein